MDSSNSKKGFNIHSFSKNITIFSIGQFLVLIFGLVQTFIIPKYLNMEDYGYWQIFILYSGYIGFLHLGYLDGLLVRWAGRDNSTISGEIQLALKFLLFEQISILAFLSIIIFFFSKNLFFLLGLSILLFAAISNLVAFFLFLLQATKNFRIFSLIIVFRNGIFILLLLVIILLTNLSLLLTIGLFIGSYAFILLIMIYRYKYFLFNIQNKEKIFSFGQENIKIGFYILLGNLIFLLISSANRLLVSNFAPIEQFSLFAFAISLSGIALFLVQAISQVLFPYISTSSHEEKIKIYKYGKTLLIAAWGFTLIIFLILTKIIPFYLPQYSSSLPIVQILLCSIVFSGIIQIFQINFLKVYNLQKQYFLLGVLALVFSVILMFISLQIFNNINLVAVVTVISYFLWFLMNELSLRKVLKIDLRETAKNICIITLISVIFLSTAIIENFLTQILIYSVAFLIISYTFFRSDIQYLFKLYKNS